MYLKSISMKSYGPIRNLSYTFRKNEKGDPVPLVIIGKNGCGKTLMFSNIVDMFVETKRKLYPSGILEVSDDNYYKIGSKSYINSAENTSVIQIEYGADEKISSYRDIMTRDYQKVIDKKEVTDPSVIQSQKFKDEGFFKEVTVKGFTSKNFENGIKLFFPFDRFYKPMWYNPDK